jgi:hypothetical protein
MRIKKEHLEANCFRGRKRRKGFPSETHVNSGDRVVVAV